MRSLSGTALTVFSNFKATDIFEYAEPGEAKGMGRRAGELAVQPRRAVPHTASSEAGRAVAVRRPSFLKRRSSGGGTL